MTQEEKAKAYDIALDKIKRLLGTGGNCSREDLEYVFPELAESEDERIMKDIVTYLKSVIANKGYKDKIIESWIAWLEKRGEQIPANSANTCKDEQNPIKEHDVCDFCDEKHGCVSPCPTKLIEEEKPADKVEPKFKVGDVVTNKKSKDTVKIVQILHDSYCYSGWDGAATVHSDFSISEQDNWELVGQKPEVDQHSLPVSDDSSLPTFNESIYHPCTEEVYERKPDLSEEDVLEEEIEEWLGCEAFPEGTNITPLPKAIDIVRETANHFYDFGRKQQAIRNIQCTNSQVTTPESRINEGQKKGIQIVLDNPQEYGLQKITEWSEEDERMYNRIVSFIPQHLTAESYTACINWLKSLRPQSQWKPSKEQMDMLAKVCSTLHLTSGENEIMESIYDDLKKLMEE